MKVLFVTPECAPMVKTGGLGDVSAALPQALASQGCDVAVLMPAYGDMALAGSLTDIVALPAEGAWPAAQLLRVQQPGRPTLLLLSCPALYGQAGTPYGGPGTDPHLQALRFGLLAHTAARIGSAATPCGWQAEVVHANDWPCGLAPLYLRQRREGGDGSVARSVMTIHNLAFQGVFPMSVADALQIAPSHRGIDGVEFWGELSMLKAGLQFADSITTVSPTYAREIQQPALGFGLDGVLRARADRLVGLINGIDAAVWDPATDALIAYRYDAADMGAKSRNTQALRARCGLAASEGPLFGLVGRLTSQKGVDLVLNGAARLLQQGGQLAVLGRGDPDLEQALTALAQRHPGHVHVSLQFSEALAHQIEAGADCFLMPSRFEPCGLNQMYSQAYGTPPLVTATGGLADTVTDVDARSTAGTGFVMREASQAAFDQAVQRVVRAWREPAAWRRLQQRCMQQDFSWERAAVPYVELYRTLLDAPG